MKLKSPAKINLFLNVLGKRPDGYHDIETLFERISFSDEITLTPAPSGIHVKCLGARRLPAGRGNLAWRAARLLKDRFGIKEGVRIDIQKNIPVAAGLGGGSSNAAVTLLGLNRLWKLGLGRRKMLALAGELGSDVPFFILDSSFALGRGRGEVVKKIQPPPRKIWHCLVLPNFRVLTRRAYQGLKPSSLTLKKTNVKILLHSIQKGDADSLSRLLTNSLELSLSNRVKEISQIKKRLLEEGAFGCALSGSGSAVFGLFATRRKAMKAAVALRRNGRLRVFVVSTL